MESYIHCRDTKIRIGSLEGFKDNFTVEIMHEYDRIIIFFSNEKDLINFKNQVIQQFELLERNSNV